MIKILKNKVVIETDIEFYGLELEYIGNLSIESLLPEDYLISQGRNKIIILKINTRSEIIIDLFNYFGSAVITKAKLVTRSAKKKHNLKINREALQMWNSIESNWEDMTLNWEDYEYEGRNDDIVDLNTKYEFDKEAGTAELVSNPKLIPNKKPQKRPMHRKLSGLYTKGNEFKKATNLANYVGFYFVDLVTKKVYTKSGEELIVYKEKKLTRKEGTNGSRTSPNSY